MDITTTARVKTLGSITKADDDALIAVLVTAVSARIEEWLQRHVQSTSRTEYYDARPRQSSIYVRGYPIASVTSIANDPDWDFTTLMASTEYSILGSTRTGRIAINPSIALIPGPGALRVIYTGGMAADTSTFISTYPDVSLAADQQILHEYQRRRQLGAVSSSIGQHSATIEPGVDLLPIVKTALRRHRREVTGGHN